MILKDISPFYSTNFSKFFFLLFCWTVLIFSSSQINGSFINKANAQTCTGTNLPINGATASGSESTHPPADAIDNNFGTRWSNSLSGSWIRVDLGSTQNICSVDIAWYNGNARQYHFVIATSTDGTTLNSEKYIIPATDARYVRVTVNGNTQNSYASMYEIDIFGSSSPPTSCTTNLPISGATASGSESTNPPSNAIDNNFATRWSNGALGSWIRVDLGST